MDSPAFEPGRLGPLTLRNRIVKAATFEGASPRGEVTDALVDFHRRVGVGGAAMTTVAYLAVSPEGRTDRHCIVADDASVPGLARLTDAVHATGAAVAAQLGHAGPVANARSNRSPSLAPSRYVSPLGTISRAATSAELDRITRDYAHAARLLVATGFDCLEIHLGHNYLLSAFLSPRLNRRTDQYGGDVANRARLARRVVSAVRDAAGDTVAVTAKLNMADGVPRGLWLNDSLEVARLLESDGALDAITLTAGSSLANPMYIFRGEAPRREFAATLPPALRAGFRLVGRRFMPDYPFEEAFNLPYARQFRAALGMPLVLLGGINRLDTIEHALAGGFAFVSMARALLREPDLVDKMRRGASSASLCIHCNKCVPTIYRGTRCVIVPEVTGPEVTGPEVTVPEVIVPPR
jgi:2,4-dienoyl-CoA reductase-like NADH-dependent reductase (Old Yellow Enzyme family)